MNIINVLEKNLDELIRDLSTPSSKFNAELMSDYSTKAFNFLIDVGIHHFEDYLPKDYKEFLLTPYWKIIAYRVKERYNFKCAVCNSALKLHCHHKSYDNHYFEHLNWEDDLICLCSKCHSKFHEVK